MDYPVYKKKNTVKNINIIAAVILGIGISLVMSWFIYLQGIFIFIILSIFSYKVFRGFKYYFSMFASLLIWLIIIDIGNHHLSWSIHYVLPAFVLTLVISLTTLILISGDSWSYNYDTYVYSLMINVVLLLMLLSGNITAVPLVIVSISFAALSIIIIPIKIGNKYLGDIGKFLHIS